MQKQEIFYLGSCRSEKHVLFWARNIKVPFGMGHPPTCTSNQSICVEEGSWVTNLQSEFNYLDLFTFYSVFKISASSAPGGRGRWVGGI